jgi:MFS family permease
MLLLRIPGGIVADRFGSRRGVISAAAAMGFAALVLTRAVDYRLLIIAQFLSGFARAAFWPAMQSYVSRIEGYSLNDRMGWFMVATSIGGVVGPVVGGLVVGRVGYGTAFALGVGLSASAALLTLGLSAKLERQQDGETASDIVSDVAILFRKPEVYRTGLLTFIAALPLAAASSFYPVYVRWIGQSPEVVGTLSSFRTATTAVIALVFGYIVDRLGRRRVFAVGAAAAVLAFGLTPGFTTVPFLAGAFVFIGLCQAFINLTALTLVGEWSSPERRGLAMAVNGTFWSISLLITPTLVGAITQLYSIQTAFYCLAAAAALLSVAGYQSLVQVISIQKNQLEGVQ